MSTRTTYVLQYEHDCSRVHEEPRWQWVDDQAWVSEADAQTALVKRKARHAENNNRFTRAFRIVKRTTTITDEVI